MWYFGGNSVHGRNLSPKLETYEIQKTDVTCYVNILKGLELIYLIMSVSRGRELIDREKNGTDTVLCEMYLGFIYVKTRFFGPKLNYYTIKDEKNPLLANFVLLGDFGRNPYFCILFEFVV